MRLNNNSLTNIDFQGNLNEASCQPSYSIIKLLITTNVNTCLLVSGYYKNSAMLHMHFKWPIKSVTTNILLTAKQYCPVRICQCWTHLGSGHTETCMHTHSPGLKVIGFFHATWRSVPKVGDSLLSRLWLRGIGLWDVKVQSSFLSPESLCESQYFGFHVTFSLKSPATGCQLWTLWWTWFSFASKMYHLLWTSKLSPTHLQL